MTSTPEQGPEQPSKSLGDRITRRIERRLATEREPPPGVWLGLGMMGLIGWSVAIPPLLGVALGTWLDRHHPASHSWALALLGVGLCVGCWSAWRWVAREHQHITRGGPHDG